jgi:hypothetical protein
MNSVPTNSLYATSLEEVLWGGILVVITMNMHGIGMLVVLRINLVIKHWLGATKSVLLGLVPVVFASWLMMLVHLTEVAVWALFFFWKGAFVNRSLAYYFSLNEYTTVGSSFSLPFHWRLLEGMLAGTGLLTFAWSAGILFALAQEFQKRQMRIFMERHQKQPPGSRHESNS